ncbi:hypothetical protein [Roseivirga thermotolerans]|uniref:Uncharacterized protein n=1 Tax=Roseivirga thermotolerans TaxID=1758176 RepID=A0ABQ3IBS6_9BACT|nr:hypothetical protein [Roseivirga thermotolerans]GHE71374.1 hypothetical protein GCM10011340_29170 [Roseivirga thermotolerans]
MTDVIQVWKSLRKIEKPDYIPEARQLEVWESKLVCKTGYLENSTLYLPVGTESKPDIKTDDLMIIQDIDGFDALAVKKDCSGQNLPEHQYSYILAANPQFVSFSKPAKPRAFEIFRIEKNESGGFDIHLNYTDNHYYIGLPERVDHKIGELYKDKPLRFKINGKADFTLSSRKQRTFYEYDHILEYLGQAESIIFKDLSQIEKKKTVPTQSKLVDERRILI